MTSGLRRAVETAAILGARWGVDPRVDERLNEISYGEWDGLPWTEIDTFEDLQHARQLLGAPS